MITPQDIRQKSFEKAVFGGYDMAMVDEFMEEVAKDLGLLQRENSVLRGKMKVLVDKVDEYRNSEDALRNAVLSAQRLGATIEQEARDKAQALVEDAQNKADAILQDSQGRADALLQDSQSQADAILQDAQATADRLADSSLREAEEQRLAEAKRVSTEFLDRMDQLCSRQMEFLKRIREMDFAAVGASGQTQAPAPPAPAPVPDRSDVSELHETVRSIGETVARAMEEPVVNVRPGIGPVMVEDERPTRAFNIVTDAEDEVNRPVQFSLDDTSK